MATGMQNPWGDSGLLLLMQVLISLLIFFVMQESYCPFSSPFVTCQAVKVVV